MITETCPTWAFVASNGALLLDGPKAQIRACQSPNPHFFPVDCSVAGSRMAQQFPWTLPPDTVYGRLGIGPGPGQAIPLSLIQHLVTYTVGPVGSSGPILWRRHQRSGCGQCGCRCRQRRKELFESCHVAGSLFLLWYGKPRRSPRPEWFRILMREARLSMGRESARHQLQTILF